LWGDRTPDSNNVNQHVWKPHAKRPLEIHLSCQP
jgi:hypothetical protein